MSRAVWNHPLFDGERLWENACVVIEDGIITSITEAEHSDPSALLMPGLIDAHTHMNTSAQVDTMLKNGVVATCDVAASAWLVENAHPFTIVSSAGMTMGTLNGRGYVKNALQNNASYIKVLLFEPSLMPKPVLKSICQAAHENARKVAVHATSLKAEKMALDCGADILLHVPMKEILPEDLAQEIAARGVAVAPTLIMMEAFAHSGQNGYLPEHYQNAENAVRTLHQCGVTLLAGTDANPGSFAPAVAYGTSMHREMELLCNAGLTPLEVLTSATKNVQTAFGLEGLGCVRTGQKANLLVVKGRPDRDIRATRAIRHIWADGEQVL